jgi:hypothetical protein
MSNKDRKLQIFAYGFDAAGFVTPTETIERENYAVRFLDLRANQSLEKADGLVLPSGIFETTKVTRDYDGSSIRFECDNDYLAKREKEVMHNLRRGGWTAFLLRSVDNGSGRFENSDLAKRFLNMAFCSVESHDPNPHMECKSHEFADYLHDYGINRITFEYARGQQKPRILASAGRGGAHHFLNR